MEVLIEIIKDKEIIEEVEANKFWKEIRWGGTYIKDGLIINLIKYLVEDDVMEVIKNKEN